MQTRGSHLVTATPEETTSFGRSVAGELRAGDVLALIGELGAGKTHFVKGLAAGLGLDEAAVTSPTFTLLHEYHGGRLPLYHSDFYRLETMTEAAALGLEEIFDADGVSVVEWADKFPALLPARTRWWRLRITGDQRHIEQCEPPGESA